MAGLRAKSEKYSLWKHATIHHGGELEKEDLELRIVERHKSPLSRQVHEGVELELNKADVIMNSKTEWNNSKMPRIVIEAGMIWNKTKRVG